jgi:hypothetical protein
VAVEGYVRQCKVVADGFGVYREIEENYLVCSVLLDGLNKTVYCKLLYKHEDKQLFY